MGRGKRGWRGGDGVHCRRPAGRVAGIGRERLGLRGEVFGYFAGRDGSMIDGYILEITKPYVRGFVYLPRLDVVG